MCLALIQTQGVRIPNSHLRNGWDNNPDGAGFMYCKNGELVIEKPFFDYIDFSRAYRKAWQQYGASSPFVVHFRYATHGAQDEVNTHPHELADGRIGLVHNGILMDFIPDPDYKISDTAWFCLTVLAARDEYMLMDSDFLDWIGKLIDISNKFILLRGDGQYVIVNEKSGHWNDGIWYSNHGYRYVHELRKPKIDDVPPDQWDSIPGGRHDPTLWDDSPADGYRDLDMLEEKEWQEEMRRLDNEFNMRVG